MLYQMYLVTNDGMYDRKFFTKRKIVFIYCSRMMANLSNVKYILFSKTKIRQS